MAWLFLFLAGIFEIIWAVGLKYSEGFTRLWPSLATLFSAALSFLLLGLAVKQLPLGTAYAIWVGIGVVGTALLGIWFFEESVSVMRVLSLLLIVVGVIGLKLATLGSIDSNV